MLLFLEELPELLLLLLLFDELRLEELQLLEELELTFLFELLRLFDCCCCCSCWRHLARRFLNQTWKWKNKRLEISKDTGEEANTSKKFKRRKFGKRFLKLFSTELHLKLYCWNRHRRLGRFFPYTTYAEDEKNDTVKLFGRIFLQDRLKPLIKMEV